LIDVSLAAQPVVARASRTSEVQPALQMLARAIFSFVTVTVALFGLSAWLAWTAGVFHSELGRESDEAAHYVTGLMVRDYISAGFPESPLDFAKNYYAHYPKVALGHWPPVFYVLEAAWMLVFGVSRTSVLCLMLLLDALLGATVFATIRRAFKSAGAGIAAAVLLVSIPLVQECSSVLMSDLPVALFSFWAVLAWAGYVETPSWRAAMLFALLSSAAILVKGNGFALALMAPAVIALCKVWRVLKRPSLLVSAALIAVLCIPWNIFTRALVAPTMQGDLAHGFVPAATWFYASHLFRAAGLVISAFAFTGIIIQVILPFRRGRIAPLWGAALAQILAVIVFHIFIPAGFEKRYLIAALPCVLMFAAAGVAWTAGQLDGIFWTEHGWAAALLAFVTALFFINTFSIPPKWRLGFDEVAAELTSNPEFRNAVILCAANQGANGEGVLISEVAMREARPGHMILRGTRMLADSDWNGRQYRLKVHTPDEVQRFLESVPVNVVVLDLMPMRPAPHLDLLRDAMRNSHWKRLGVYPMRVDALTSPKSRIEAWKQLGVNTRRSNFKLKINPTPHSPIWGIASE
jgi:hypothetical protein